MSADGMVPPNRPTISIADVVVGAPVRAQTWHDMAKLAHWVAARGQVVVPVHQCGVEFSAASVTLRYKVPLSGRALGRVWVFDIRAAGAVGSVAAFTIQAGAETTTYTHYVESLGGEGIATAPFYVLEGAGSGTELTRSRATTEITVTITHVGGTLRIESVGCWELPRPALARDTTDLGTSLDSFFPRRPIFDASASPTSEAVSGVTALAYDITTAARLRRIGHIARYGNPLLITSTSWVSLTVLPYRVVPRLDLPTDTTLPLTLDIYAKCSDGSTAGEYQIVNGAASVDGGTIAAGTTTAAWIGDIELAFGCEDPTTADGLRSATYDTLDIQVKRTAGAGTISVYGWCAYEAA